MKKFGLIGWPIAHSLSPLLFRAGYHTDGNRSGYVPARQEEWMYDLIEGDDFGQSWQKFLDGYDGINVTAPFKEQAFAEADLIDPVCRQIGATNLTVKTSEGIKAYNTDYYGILLSILEEMDRQEGSGLPRNEGQYHGIKARPSVEECRKSMKGRLHSALVVGCGGAGKAAAVAAGSLGLDTILMNRTEARAEAIADALPEYRFRVRPLSDFKDCFAAADLILYTLPAPIPDIGSLTERDFAPARHASAMQTGDDYTEHVTANRKILLEANYRNPSFPAEMTGRQRSLHKGFAYIPGIRWLLYQAYAGYDLFTGRQPDLVSMENAVTE